MVERQLPKLDTRVRFSSPAPHSARTQAPAVRKLPKPGDYRVQSLHGGSEQLHEPTRRSVCSRSRRSRWHPGEVPYARADFVEFDGQPT
jgi:hypothetical protein